MRRLAILCVPALLTLAFSAPGDIVATVNGVPIRSDELAEFQLADQRDTPEGQQILDQLITEVLIAAESARRGVAVTDFQLDQRIRELDREVREASAGALGLEDQLRDHGVEPQRFRELLRKNIAWDEMLREDFGLSPGQPIPDEKRSLWLKEKMLRADVVRAGLPADVAVRVGGEDIPRWKWAETLYETLGEEARRQLLDDLIDVRLIVSGARELGIEATSAEKTQAIRQLDEQLHRKLRAEGLNTEGVSYLQLLEQRGVDPQEYLRSDRFLARVLIKKLADHFFGADGYREFYDQHRELFDARYGQRVALSTVFLRAADRKTEQVPRDFGEAEEALQKMRERLGESGDDQVVLFGKLARIYSDHAASAGRAGALGELTREDLEKGGLPGSLLAAPVGQMVGPHVVKGGVHLLLVTGHRAASTFEELSTPITVEARRETLERLRAEAAIEYAE